MLTSSEAAYLEKTLSFWNSLTETEKSLIQNVAYTAEFHKGRQLYRSGKECLGLVLVERGQLRAYIISDEGRQISLYRLLEMDICILSASCMVKNINFDIHMEAEKPSRIFIIPTEYFHKISEKNVAVKNFSLELMAARFSEVMWVFEQFVFGSLSSRLANFLLEQSNFSGNTALNLTHEFIANDLGTAREVITRLLKHFATDGIVSLSRGIVKIEDMAKLKGLC